MWWERRRVSHYAVRPVPAYPPCSRHANEQKTTSRLRISRLSSFALKERSAAQPRARGELALSGRCTEVITVQCKLVCLGYTMLSGVRPTYCYQRLGSGVSQSDHSPDVNLVALQTVDAVIQRLGNSVEAQNQTHPVFGGRNALQCSKHE